MIDPEKQRRDALFEDLRKLKDDIHIAMDEVASALESGERNRQLEAGQLIEPLVARYTAIREQLHPEEHDRLERDVGRKLTDLRRDAGKLTKQVGGSRVQRAVDAGAQPFILQRAPGKSLLGDRADAFAKREPRYVVGGEVESWCGKCKEMRTHHIFAVVDDLPRQVICVQCKSRHNYRTEPPPRRPGDGAGDDASKAPRTTPKNPAAVKAAEQRRTLEQELMAVADPRAFDPKDTFKTGQIIAHPKYGRGKIENVLKGSLLVRFLDGLRPLSRA